MSPINNNRATTAEVILPQFKDSSLNDLSRIVARYKESDSWLKNTTISEEGPYYALEMSLRYSTSLGGICINDNMQVLNANNEAVEGLYAAGEVIGGVQGDLYLPSSTFTWAMTSGVQTGKVVSELLAK